MNTAPDQPYSIEEQDRLAAQQAEAARIKASQDFGRLDRLMQSEDWQWFTETHLAPIVARERAAARRLSDGKDKVWEHCHRLEVAEEMAGKLEAAHEIAARASLIKPVG